MKKAILAALVISASIGSQALNAATTGTTKVGTLSFSLVDTYQWEIFTNGVQSAFGPSSTVLADCAGTVKYTTKSQAITTKTIIAAIGKTLKLSFTSNAKLVLWNYDNDLNAPPYPPYLIPDLPSSTYNGPRDGVTSTSKGPSGTIDAMGLWPNYWQIDWVEYDRLNGDTTSGSEGNAGTSTAVPGDLWPKAIVFISDPKNATVAAQCVDVSPFFSFEEAYCYFCWDTVDRVTSGSIKSSLNTSGNACLSPNGCGISGNGTTKFYLKIKFNNNFGAIIADQWLGANNYDRTVYALSAVNVLSFSVDGVVSYPWVMNSTKLSVPTPFGTMSMSDANGYGNNPFCGVIKGSVSINETTDASVPICDPEGPLTP